MQEPSLDINHALSFQSPTVTVTVTVTGISYTTRNEPHPLNLRTFPVSPSHSLNSSLPRQPKRGNRDKKKQEQQNQALIPSHHVSIRTHPS